MFGTNGAIGIPTATNVDHLGVTVPDLQQAIVFFTDVLGAEFLFSFKEGPGTSNPANLNEAFGVPKDSKLQIAMLRLGPTLNLELMEYKTSDQRELMPRNSDFDAPHIAFFVSDMDAAAEYLTRHGCKLFSGPLVSENGPKQGQAIRYFQAPWGMFLEILSRPERMPYDEHTNSRLFGPVTINGGYGAPKQVAGMSAARERQMVNVSRSLIALPFLMNALGVVPQNLTAAALVRAGFSEESVPFLVQAGRALQLTAGLALASGKFPKSAAAVLTTFLIGATIIGHPFWKAPDQKSKTQDKAATCVNVGLLGALLYVASVHREAKQADLVFQSGFSNP